MTKHKLIVHFVLFFILTLPLFSLDIFIEDEYCIKGKNVNLSDFVADINKDKVLFDMPDNSSSFTVKTSVIADKLTFLGYDVIQNEKGRIKFKKFCDFNISILEDKFVKALKTLYPKAMVNSLEIEAKNFIPDEIAQMKLKNISVSKASLRKQNGVFLARFIALNGRIKSIYFSFLLDASMKVYESTEDIKSGTLLSSQLYTSKNISIDKLPLDILEDIAKDKLIARFNIKKGTILTENAFKKKNLIRRGSLVIAILQDGALSVQVQAKALNSGNTGDKIRILTSEGKTFSAIVKNEKIVLIQ